MKLKQVNGKVSFIMKAGMSFVKNEMPVAEAEKFIKDGKITESDKFEGYPICVDDIYYFAATMPKTKVYREEQE